MTSVLYAAVVVHDIVRSVQSGVGAPVELFPYALVLWILAEAYQLLQELQQSFEQVESLSEELGDANFELQETEAAIVRFVPFDFLRTLGKESIRDVEAGDYRAIGDERAPLWIPHAGESGAGPIAVCEADFERINDLVSPSRALHRSSKRLPERLPRRRLPGVLSGWPARRRRGRDRDPGGGARLQSPGSVERALGCRAPTLRVGIGIDTGWVQLGTIGSGQHLVRGVVGEPVEGARRIEVAAFGAAGTLGRLLISAATREGLGEDCPFELRPVEGSPWRRRSRSDADLRGARGA